MHCWQTPVAHALSMTLHSLPASASPCDGLCSTNVTLTGTTLPSRQRSLSRGYARYGKRAVIHPVGIADQHATSTKRSRRCCADPLRSILGLDSFLCLLRTLRSDGGGSFISLDARI
jgi:hypothetical protein